MTPTWRIDSGWLEKAACRNHPAPEVFFPRGRVDTAARRKAVSAVRSWCRDCAARRDCARFALAHGHRVGVWAGVDLGDDGHAAPNAQQQAALREIATEVKS